MAESVRFVECSEEEKIFESEGLKHWIEKTKEILKIPNLKFIKQLEKEDIDKVLSHVKSRDEQRELKKVLEQIVCLKELVHVPSNQTTADVDDSLKDQSVENSVSSDDVRLLKSVDKSKFRIAYEPPQGQSKDKISTCPRKENIESKAQNKNQIYDESWEVVGYSTSEIFKTVGNGILCKGIYFSTNLNELVQERDTVMYVGDKLEHRPINPNREIFHHTFTSEKQMEMFEKNIDKHIAPRSETVGENIWGVKLDQGNGDKGFLSSLHLQLIPAACIALKPQDIHLTPDVIAALRDTEASLKQTDSDPSNLFKDIYSRYGTHVNNGDIFLGGILISIAYCKGFSEKDREKIKNVVSEASERAIYLSLSDQISLNSPINAYNVLGMTSKMSSEDLQNITVIVKRVGGPTETTDLENWTKQLLENTDTWTVIGRQSIPLPMWKLLEQDAEEFEDFQKFKQAMIQAWRTLSTDRKKEDNAGIFSQVPNVSVSTKGEETGVDRKTVTEKDSRMEGKQEESQTITENPTERRLEQNENQLEMDAIDTERERRNEEDGDLKQATAENPIENHSEKREAVTIQGKIPSETVSLSNRNHSNDGNKGEDVKGEKKRKKTQAKAEDQTDRFPEKYENQYERESLHIQNEKTNEGNNHSDEMQDGNDRKKGPEDVKQVNINYEEKIITNFGVPRKKRKEEISTETVQTELTQEEVKEAKNVESKKEDQRGNKESKIETKDPGHEENKRGTNCEDTKEVQEDKALRGAGEIPDITSFIGDHNTNEVTNIDKEAKREKCSSGTEEKSEKRIEHEKNKYKSTKTRREKISTCIINATEADFTAEQTRLKCPQDPTRETNKRKLTVTDLRILLRRDIKLWISSHLNHNESNAFSNMEKLLDLKQKYIEIQKWWQDDAVYLRDVQRLLTWTSSHMKILPEEKRKKLAHILQAILGVEPINSNQFPTIRMVRWRINECLKKNKPNLFHTQNVVLFPDAMSNLLDMCHLSEAQKSERIEYIQHRLESSFQEISKKRQKTYEYLICLNILRLFGFRADDLIFKNSLSEKEVRSLTFKLHNNFQAFAQITDASRKQAFVLRLSLFNVQEQQSTIQYTLNNLPSPLCPDLQDAYKRSLNNHNVLDPIAFRDHLYVSLFKTNRWFEKSLCLQPLTMQLPFREKKQNTKDTIQRDKDIEPTEPVAALLNTLNMRHFYPQKLTYQEVITLTQEVSLDAFEKPTNLTELPWYFIRSIIRIDSDTRENCHVSAQIVGSSSDESDAEDDNKNDIISTVHPLDLIYIIFLCADDFLRQELADKMSLCQYAVPLVLPSSELDGKAVLLHWGLQNLSRIYYCEEKVVNKAMVDARTPLVLSVSIGRENSWKSRLLNEMLSPQQRTFWHQGLKGGSCKQRVSKGMVELSWYLPGRDENKFQHPVAFLNTRGNGKYSHDVCEIFHESASVTCIFVDDVQEELISFLDNIKSRHRMIVVILHEKKKTSRMKEESRKLKQKYHFEDTQIIRRTAEDKNFDDMLQQLKQSIEVFTTESSNNVSIAEVASVAKCCKYIEVDDMACYQGQMAANSILNDIDYYNKLNQGSAKRIILPSQSSIQIRKDMAAAERELCCQKRRGETTTIPIYAESRRNEIKARQEIQLQNPICDTFKYFIRCLVNFKPRDKKYFLQCLKLGLDERSIDILQPLYDEFEKCRTEKETPERNAKLKSFDEQLTHGSLGMEHFFRELAVMYENLKGIEQGPARLVDVTNGLAHVMADLLLEGTAIEIMDGDVVHVPVPWLKEIFNILSREHNLRVYTMAVLGAQSCGKSTLLNTIFGLNFPVSSGRCTRGAYMQLVKVGDEMKKYTKCDYVAVIDTEGLMSRTKSDDYNFDNELCTFVTGLSDLTLVNRGFSY